MLLPKTRPVCVHGGFSFAFHAEENVARPVVMDDAQVDPEPRHPDLRHHVPALALERPRHGLLERRVRNARASP